MDVLVVVSIVHLESSVEMCHTFDRCSGVTPHGHDAFVACERNSSTCSWISSLSRSSILPSSSKDESLSSESLSDIYHDMSVLLIQCLLQSAHLVPFHTYTDTHHGPQVLDIDPSVLETLLAAFGTLIIVAPSQCSLLSPK